MTSRETAEKIAAILEAVAAGTLDVETAIQQGPDLERERDRLLTSAWHHLQHFSDDSYIRASDLNYDRTQRDVLLRYAQEIRRAFALGNPS